MDPTLQVVFSNRIEELYAKFKKTLFAQKSLPFAQRLVIVPSPALKSWLMLQLAKDPDVGIAAGLEISYLDQSVQKVREILCPGLSSIHLPNAMELALLIEWEIKSILQKENGDIWNPLIAYLHVKPQVSWSRKSERRLIALSEKLASLFLEYGKYGGQVISEWETKPGQNWQQELWNRIFKKERCQTYLYRELKNFHPVHAIPHLSIHLFSMSFLPKLHYRFFSEVSTATSVYHYLLSPCQLFWSDLFSEKEATHILHRLKNQGASSSKQKEWESYLKDGHPLLANFGKVGREMARQIEEQASMTDECYEAISEKTLLQTVQMDMLLLRNPAESPKVSFEKFDKSIQVHAAPTLLREVQVIYDILLNIIDKHSNSENPIYPNDIIVMSPNISDYEPFIKMVFMQAESLLDAHMMDLHLSSQSPLVQGFLHLLSLPFSRWDAASLLQLFHDQAFSGKQRWGSEELHLIDKWIKESGINWGHNHQHRDELLRRDHCLQGMVDNSPAGTWEFGMERLLAGLIYDSSPYRSLPMAPYEEIDFSKSELLGQVLGLLRSLYAELRPLADSTMLSLLEWADYLQYLLEKYFEGDDQKDLMDSIDTFRKASPLLPSSKYSFLSIKKHLEASLSRQTASYQESHLSAVRFCSMLPMRTIPAKVIVLMGLHEEAFPRKDQKLSLNLLVGNPQADFMPSQTDFDRYLFLESLLSARDYFIMSYLNYSSKDSKEQPPSLLVTELVNYLNNAYEIPGKFCHFKHPFNAFDKVYFTPDSLYPSYSQEHYLHACAFYHVQKKPLHRFIPHFIPAELKRMIEDLQVDLKDLSAFAKNPLKAYFNHVLGIYLENSEDQRLSIDEKFQLSPLERDELKKTALKVPLQEVIGHHEKKGQLPLGVFKALAIDRVIQDAETIKDNIKNGGVDPENLFEIEFSHLYTDPKLTEKGCWQLPPLFIPYQQSQITLIGKFQDVSNQGLVLHRKADRADIVKVFPKILIFQSLIKQYSLPMQARYIFPKDGKVHTAFAEDPNIFLKRYLDYYFFGMEHASLLIPEWVPYLFTADDRNIQEKLMSHKNLYNDYVHWMCRNGCFPNIENTLEEWKALAKSLYGDFFCHWMNEKGSKDDKE